MARRFLTYLRSQWMGALALFLVIAGGTAYAANTIGSSDIIDESILSQDIKNGQVHSADLGNNQITSTDVRDDTSTNGGLGAADLAPGSVGSSEVVDESLTSSDLGTDSVQATEVADNSLDTGEIVDNSLFAADLAPDSVGASELANNAVGSANVSNNSLSTTDLIGADTNGAVSLSGIANGRCSQVTFNVSGTQVGEVPLVITRAAIQNGIVMYANRVASAGHVEVNACNFSGGAMTAISNFPVRVVTLG